MAVIYRGPRLPNETDEQFRSREEEHWSRVDEAVDRLRALRDVHTNKGKQPVKRRTV